MQFIDIKEVPGIYCFENLESKKVYIGSSEDIATRVYNHIWHLSHNEHPNRHFQNSYNKKNGENFIVYTLHQCNIYSLLEWEQKYFDTFLYAQEYILSNGKDDRFLKLSYNLTPTAGKTLGFKHNDETLRMLSELAKERWKDPQFIYSYFKTRNREWIDSLVNKLKLSGRYDNLEYRNKLSISASNSEYNKKIRKSVLAYNRVTGEFVVELESINEAARYFNIDKARIQKVLKNKVRYTKDIHFKYKTSNKYDSKIEPISQYIDHDKRMKVLSSAQSKRRRPIEQFDLNGNFITDFSSAYEAVRKLTVDLNKKNISVANINACATGKANTAYGFIWKFKQKQLPLQS